MHHGPPRKNLQLHSDYVIAGFIFVITFVVFWISPIHQMTDSTYSMLLSQNVLKFHSFALDHYAISTTEVSEHTQLETVDNHVYYYPPAGGPVLSIPIVAIMNAFNLSAANADGSPNHRGEAKMQAIVAPLLMAALAVVFFLTARLLLTSAWSTLIALGAAFGSQVWSTASRVLWSHTWEIALLGVAIWMLLAAETGKRKLRPMALATVLAWAYFCRPTAFIPILAITLYMLLAQRRLFVWYALAGSFWALLFAIYSWIHFRHFVPRYYREQVSVWHPLLSLSGSLFSPSRGLLVYLPVLFFVVYLLGRYWQDMPHRRLAWLALLVVLGHLITLSSLRTWWGGGCYGARLTTDLVPWFVLLTILGTSAMLRWKTRPEAHASMLNWRVPLVAGLVLLAFSIFINARGAISQETVNWENWRWQRPIGERDTASFWEWRYPQFLAGLLHPPLPDSFPVAEGQIDLGSDQSTRFLWYGWSGSERPTRWTDGHQAAIIFARPGSTDVLLEMQLAPFVGGNVQEQNVHVYLNEKSLVWLNLTGAWTRNVSLTLPANLLREKNVLRFSLPNASSPYAAGIGEDERLLGIKVEWVRFRIG